MPPNQDPRAFSPFADDIVDGFRENTTTVTLRCAILGCGMMGQEHCSYIMGFPDKLRIDFLCDPHQPSLDKCCKVMNDFRSSSSDATAAGSPTAPTLLHGEDELLKHVDEIDLLVIASPNYLHTDAILRWGQYSHLTILVEKPVAVSREQHALLQKIAPELQARIWVAMEYRFIPAIAKLIELLDTVGDIKMVTIRENRYPFLHKIEKWNRDRNKTGDTLVEKCCHFFDLMRLITGKEADLQHIRALAQRGINYEDEPAEHETPIIDAAYVTMPFQSNEKVKTLGCLELCMYAEGSRHQEEIIVTGTKGRLEAYLPENMVYSFERPSAALWSNRSEPPPPSSIQRRVYDCSNVMEVHGIENAMPTHGGYHYCSTAVEWFKLLDAIHVHQQTGVWKPLVSLEDGLRAVEIGLQATQALVNEINDTVNSHEQRVAEIAHEVTQDTANDTNVPRASFVQGGVTA